MESRIKYRFSARHSRPLILALLLIGITAGPALGQRSRRGGDAFADKIRAEMKIVLDQSENSDDLYGAIERAHELFDQVIAYAPEGQADLFREVALAVRLLKFSDEVGDSEILRYLREHPEVAAELLFLWQEGQNQRPYEIAQCLNRLRKAHGDRLDRYPNLAAAICVVHDVPVKQRVGLLELTAGDPADTFAFFSGNENRLSFGVRTMPSELLTFLVDSVAPVNEMAWALEEYQGHQQVGSLFFDIEYDYDHLRKGTQKKCVSAGFSLPSIQQYGGVCAEQAYFASSVGKSIGVPAVYTRGRSGEVAHAWVGFLETKGRRAWWNFDAGRYDAYQGLRGEVVDPRSRSMIPDSYVAVMAELVGTNTIARQTAVAFVDASMRLRDWQSEAPEPLVEKIPKGYLRRPRNSGIENQLDLIQAGLKASPGHVPGWQAVAWAARDSKMSYEQKQYWADVLARMCGTKYPDFSVDILRPMIESERDPNLQVQLWERAWAKFNSRDDIAAEIRFTQGEVLEQAGDLRMAEKCFLDVVNRSVNAGPFVMRALSRLEKMYRDAGRPDAVVGLYGDAWRKAKRPQASAAIYFQQSNWFQIGARYARALGEAGRQSEAARVHREIGL